MRSHSQSDKCSCCCCYANVVQTLTQCYDVSKCTRLQFIYIRKRLVDIFSLCQLLFCIHLCCFSFLFLEIQLSYLIYMLLSVLIIATTSTTGLCHRGERGETVRLPIGWWDMGDRLSNFHIHLWISNGTNFKLVCNFLIFNNQSYRNINQL